MDVDNVTQSYYSPVQLIDDETGLATTTLGIMTRRLEGIFRVTRLTEWWINTYGYVGGNPLTRIDPDGRCFRCFLGLVSGGQLWQI